MAVTFVDALIEADALSRADQQPRYISFMVGQPVASAHDVTLERPNKFSYVVPGNGTYRFWHWLDPAPRGPMLEGADGSGHGGVVSIITSVVKAKIARNRPNIAVGQVWKDVDTRMNSRAIKITAIGETHVTGRIGVFRTDGAFEQSNRAGKLAYTNVRIDRLRPGLTGAWRLVAPVPNDPKLKPTGWYDETHRDTLNGLPKENLEALNEDIERAVKRYFEQDEDGDYPVRVSVLDRTREQSAFFQPLLHTYKIADPDAKKQAALENLRRAIGNAREAGDQLRHAQFVLEEVLK